MDENLVTYFAETDARNKRVKFGIKAKDRARHVYVIGKTGMGKSCLLENMAVQDIQNGDGICFIDPHGKTADLLLEYVPKERINDVIYIAPFDVEHPISFNVLESVARDKRHLVVSGLMSTFKKIWVDAWSARMEYILTNTLLALLECPGSTLLGVNKMLSDKEYRKEVVSHIEDPSVKAFWVKEFAGYTERMAAEAVPAIQNKVGQFTANPLIRNMIGQPQSSFDFRKAMDTKKIVIINLSKGRIGDENMKLLGGMLVTKIYLSAMSRADLPDRTMKIMPNFYLFVDEFQNFANASFADILSEARKYKLNLTIAHQYIEQMDEQVRAAVFGNVGTMIVFRVGATDAEFLEKEFAPSFELEDLVNLGFTQIYLKLMIDGLTSSPFSASTLPPIAHPDISYVTEIIDASRKQFARPRAQVETEIIAFHESVTKRQSPVAPSQARERDYSSRSTPPSGMVNSGTMSNIQTASINHDTEIFAKRMENIAKVAPQKIHATMSKPPPTPNAQPRHDEVKTKTSENISVQDKSHLGGSTKANSVSLSALSQVKQKSDPKIQTTQNVNELKNALAMALKKSPEPQKSSSSLTKPDQISGQPIETLSTPVVPKIPIAPVQNVPSAIPPAQQDMQPPVVARNKPNEVPEDVLKTVLKLD